VDADLEGRAGDAGLRRRSFARFAAAGTLWVRLGHDIERRLRDRDRRYRDRERRIRTEAPVGVVDKKAPKMLAILVGVVDADVRGETAWFATNEVARFAGGESSCDRG
jgi:hypothetical protein